MENKKKRVAIIGSRTIHDYEQIKKMVMETVKIEDIEFIVSAGAEGVDKLAEKFADEYELKKLIFKPEWSLYGPDAGFLRNTHVVDNSDICIAFLDMRAESVGTKYSIQKAKDKGIILHVIEVNKEASN